MGTAGGASTRASPSTRAPHRHEAATRRPYPQGIDLNPLFSLLYSNQNLFFAPRRDTTVTRRWCGRELMTLFSCCMPSSVIPKNRLGCHWPSKGEIELHNLHVRFLHFIFLVQTFMQLHIYWPSELLSSSFGASCWCPEATTHCRSWWGPSPPSTLFCLKVNV